MVCPQLLGWRSGMHTAAVPGVAEDKWRIKGWAEETCGVRQGREGQSVLDLLCWSHWLFEAGSNHPPGRDPQRSNQNSKAKFKPQLGIRWIRQAKESLLKGSKFYPFLICGRTYQALDNSVKLIVIINNNNKNTFYLFYLLHEKSFHLMHVVLRKSSFHLIEVFLTECYRPVLSNTVATSHMWLLSTWKVASQYWDML